MKFVRAGIITLIALGSAATAQDSAAGFKVYTPKVTKGEFEIEYRPAITIDGDSAKDNGQEHVLGLGYGVTDWWFTEVYAEWEREPGPGNETAFEAFEWENRFELTEPGKFWADLGLYLEYARKDDGNAPDKLEVGLIAAKSVGKFDFAVNVLFEREVGGNASDDVELVQAFQAKYRWHETFEPGIEIHSGFGAIGDMPAFDNQEHYVGPVVEGKLPLGDTGAKLKYNVGYLFGVTDEAADGVIKAEIEIEFDL
jgi:hypothetical protein